MRNVLDSRLCPQGPKRESVAAAPLVQVSGVDDIHERHGFVNLPDLACRPLLHEE